MKLTDYFIKKKINNLIQESPGRKHESRTVAKINHAIIMYQDTSRQAVLPVIEYFRQEKKQLTECIYLSAGGPDDKWPKDALLFDPVKQTNPLYYPHADLVKKFLALPADLLIDLTPPDCYLMHYLMLQHPCPFKVGIKYGEQTMHDLSLSITDNKDMRELAKQLLFYLQSVC